MCAREKKEAKIQSEDGFHCFATNIQLVASKRILGPFVQFFATLSR